MRLFLAVGASLFFGSGPLLRPICLLAATPGARVKREAHSESTPRGVDACSLLTDKEIETVQGVPLTSRTPTRTSEKGLDVSQCYFLLRTADDSIVLRVMRRDKGRDSGNPKKLWEETFHREKEEPNDRDEKEGEAPPPQKIRGFGGEAFWTPQRFGGVLHILERDVYFTISIGGPGDQVTKIKKSKALAEIVLKRL